MNVKASRHAVDPRSASADDGAEGDAAAAGAAATATDTFSCSDALPIPAPPIWKTFSLSEAT